MPLIPSPPPQKRLFFRTPLPLPPPTIAAGAQAPPSPNEVGAARVELEECARSTADFLFKDDEYPDHSPKFPTKEDFEWQYRFLTGPVAQVVTHLRLKGHHRACNKLESIINEYLCQGFYLEAKLILQRFKACYMR